MRAQSFHDWNCCSSLEDGVDADEPIDDSLRFGRVVVKTGLTHDLEDGLQLVENLLEPQLVDLVDSDEHHLVMLVK